MIVSYEYYQLFSPIPKASKGERSGEAKHSIQVEISGPMFIMDGKRILPRISFGTQNVNTYSDAHGS